jgi:hypothetical protein
MPRRRWIAAGIVGLALLTCLVQSTHQARAPDAVIRIAGNAVNDHMGGATQLRAAVELERALEAADQAVVALYGGRHAIRLRETIRRHATAQRRDASAAATAEATLQADAPTTTGGPP